MCGIAGIVWTDPNQPVEVELLRRMSEAIRHRGPDDEGVWTGPGVGLAHRRLSVIDLSPAGHQPMTNEDGSVRIVYNGEIYNFLELRKELLRKGHDFRSQTDTEVIVHLYEEEGERCVERLDGMFAFALWDGRRRRMLLARDRVGKKLLKYSEIPAGLAFSIRNSMSFPLRAFLWPLILLWLLKMMISRPRQPLVMLDPSGGRHPETPTLT